MLGIIPSSLMDDYLYCREIVRQHKENFPVGSLLAPRRIRHHLHAVYAFARLADDFADLAGRDVDEKLNLLDGWSNRLMEARDGRPDHPVFRALGHTLKVTGLPLAPLQDLLVAFRLDVTNKRYNTLFELEDYCRYSARPVGRVVLHLSGESRPETLAWSDAICTGLQLVDHWQDLGQDPWKGRPLYCPMEVMYRFGVNEKQILERRFNPAVGAMMMELVDYARQFFRLGEPLLTSVAWPLSLELGLTWEGGMALLDGIEALGGNTLRKRPRLSNSDLASCWWRAMQRVIA
ncbi:MAG: squalene synthase HpnC [Magnetococcales bacterium]|nr:squalene synthase HpnC [Magnetococcales bacterium]